MNEPQCLLIVSRLQRKPPQHVNRDLVVSDAHAHARFLSVSVIYAELGDLHLASKACVCACVCVARFLVYIRITS